jgi:flagellar protein FliL
MAEEEKQEKKEQGPPEKKKFPVMIVVIVLAVVLVLGGAAAGYFMFIGPKMKASGKEGPVKEMKHEQVKSKGSSEGEGSSGPLKQLDPFIVNLADAQGQRYLKAVMQLEVDNPSVDGEIQSKLPQIRDEILMILSNKTFDDVSTTAGKHMIKREIATSVNKYLTSGQVTQVYFTEFVVQ